MLPASRRDAMSRTRPRESWTVYPIVVLSRLDPDRDILHEANHVRAEEGASWKSRARWLNAVM